MQAKNILLLIPSLATLGGTERMVANLTELYIKAGHQVVQASFDAPGLGRNFDGSAPYHALGPFKRLPLLFRPITYVMAAYKLNRLKSALGITHTVSNLWGADLISILSGGNDRKIALCHINVVGNETNRLMLRLRYLVAAIYRRFDSVVAVSEPLADELKRLYGLQAEKTGFINNFVDRPEAHDTLPDDGVVRFVWCGRLGVEKNVSGLLHAWSLYVNERQGRQLVLLGDGPLREQLLSEASNLGLRCGSNLADVNAQVLFVGKVDRPADYMVGARALLLSSFSEGLPMVLLEALSLGTPVIASDCPSGGVRTAMLGYGQHDANADAIIDSDAGMLLPIPAPSRPESLELWKTALQRIADDDRQYRLWKEGALARSQLFNSATAMDHWQTVFDRVGA